jgi:hypothetical protein
VAALMLVAACGRIGFAVPGDASATGDAGPVADAPGNGDGGGGACASPDLVLHLRFDESAGLAAMDASGAGNHGVLVGFAGAGFWVPGRTGNALAFTGTEQVRVASTPSLSDLGTLTACAWVRPTSDPATFATIVDKSEDGYRGGWNLYTISGGGLGLYNNMGSAREGATVALDVWQHLCGTWDGTPGVGGIVLYRDGAAASSFGLPGGGPFESDAGTNLTIGRQKLGIFAFAGLLDDVRVYRRALAAAELQALYACSTGS